MPDATNLTEGERLVKLNETNTAIVRQAIEDIGNVNVEGLLAISASWGHRQFPANCAARKPTWESLPRSVPTWTALSN